MEGVEGEGLDADRLVSAGPLEPGELDVPTVVVRQLPRDVR